VQTLEKAGGGLREMNGVLVTVQGCMFLYAIKAEIMMVLSIAGNSGMREVIS
jgi:hypothetical protein